jgi:hypothetical protein
MKKLQSALARANVQACSARQIVLEEISDVRRVQVDGQSCVL